MNETELYKELGKLTKDKERWKESILKCYTDRAVDKRPKIWWNKNNENQKG